MAVYAYCRYSTGKQEEAEQFVQINKWSKSHGVEISDTVIDRAKSGSISWENRNLANLVDRLEEGDTIICSEISRISRSISDFSMFLNNAMKPRKARMVIANMNFDIDCGKLNALVEIQLAMLTFAAQMEKELNQNRTKSALEHRKELVRINGGWTSKSGNWCTRLGPQPGSTAVRISADRKKAKTMEGMNLVMEKIVKMREENMSYDSIATQLNNEGFKTSRGGDFHAIQISRMLKNSGYVFSKKKI